ncbi:MAG: formylglycine-generating enzyme family protein, partial [Acetobacteraceae bacterium]|nr:formylglycine-generating enzyme family protein [Acetobacteraceae bacterium]
MPAITWPTEAWNPRPAAGDLVLPLPCGGGIAFRRVDTPLGPSPLADRAASLGGADPVTDYQEFTRQAWLAGPFRDGAQPGSQHYFTGKYEVTADQFAAVMAETCPALPSGPGGRLPRANATWPEAVTFTQRASAWLLRHARASLPASDGAPAFLRLPTEDEWEFALRGGTAVPEAEFVARLPPMEGGIERHAWFQGAASAGGRAHPIGQLAPNPLGLHDMLGNLAEWTLDPFRLNRVGRPHGLAGGQVARGGHFRTAGEALRSSLRAEYPPVNPVSLEPTRADTLGFRVVLARVAIPGEAAPDLLRRAFEAESRSRDAASEDPARLLQLLRTDLPEGAVRAGLARIESTLLAERRARLDQESTAIRAQMEAAAQMARQVMLAAARRALNADQAERLEVVGRNLRNVAGEQERLARAATGPVQSTLGRHAADLGVIVGQTEPAARALRAAVAAAPQGMQDLTDGYLRVV